MSKTNREEPYVSSAVGGSLSQISFESSGVRRLIGPAHGGGIRRGIRGFSRSSRRNLLRHMASINRTAFRAYKGRVIAVTLTYPDEYPEDPETCKRHLEALRKRLTRRFGKFSAYWRMGIQQRGAWHFHLLLFVPPPFGPVKNLRHFVASSWYEVCGKVSEGHLLAGTRVEEVRTWRRATSYAERYVAKPEQFPEGLETGRIWGMWNEELLPVQWETVKVTLEDAFKIRRAYRKLARRKGTGSLRCFTVFIRYENVVRLLKFLGYRQEE
ncbi:MAG: helitron helicase-like domain-containing protein [Actinomycetota bacterium]|nr:helitron helicase-like domain-containing protein [Actinomycetota bacterium]